MPTREVAVLRDDFTRKISITSTNTEGGTGWTRAAAGTGTPTIASVTPAANGEIKVTLTNDNNSQYCVLYQGDDLPYYLSQIDQIEFIAKVSGIDSVTTLCFGLASALNATPDSVSTLAWFRMEGSASTSNVVVETDDGTTDNDDKATGTTLSSTFKRFTIDFTNGLSDVRFYIDGNRVASSTTFSLAAASSTQSVQPYIHLAKASGTGTPSITIDRVEILYRKSS